MLGKIDFKGFKGFAIYEHDNSYEANKLHMSNVLYDLPLIAVNKEAVCPVDYVPCSSVEWCIKALNKYPTPNYYPDWAEQYLYRKVWYQDKWIIGKKLFVKPAEKYKRFDGFITTETYKKKKCGKLVWSEVVSFENEWRYYVSGGKILCSGWYLGDEVNTPDAPKLNINIPKDYYGALDFGMLKDGKLALVESQHPFACGCYVDDDDLYLHLYFQWLIDGWKYMQKNYN